MYVDIYQAYFNLAKGSSNRAFIKRKIINPQNKFDYHCFNSSGINFY